MRLQVPVPYPAKVHPSIYYVSEYHISTIFEVIGHYTQCNFEILKMPHIRTYERNIIYLCYIDDPWLIG
jgi:hypothetical protein